MILELNKISFYKCKELLNENGQLEANAVVEGINPGRIFVDNVDSPTSGLIWLGNNDGFFFIGNAENQEFNNHLNHFIDSVIIPEARKVGLTWFEGIGNHRKWNKTIEEVFGHRKIKDWNQRVYMLKKDDDKVNFIPDIGQEYKVVKICDTLFRNTDNSIKNIEFLHSKIKEFWSSPEKFFDNGIGYCIIYSNEIVSICFSGFVVGNVHCIDIETLEGHRGKKLAQKVAQAFVQDCMDNNIVPYWDCMESNKPSVAVAERLGFKNVLDYVGYYFSF